MKPRLYSLKNGVIEQGIVVSGTEAADYVPGLAHSRPFATLADLFAVTDVNGVYERVACDIRLLDVVFDQDVVSEEKDTVFLLVHGVGEQRDVLDFEPTLQPILLESAIHVGYFTTTYVALYALNPKTSFRLLCWEPRLASYLVSKNVRVTDSEIICEPVRQVRTFVKWLRRLIA